MSATHDDEPEFGALVHRTDGSTVYEILTPHGTLAECSETGTWLAVSRDSLVGVTR